MKFDVQVGSNVFYFLPKACKSLLCKTAKYYFYFFTEITLFGFLAYFSGTLVGK